ncbi:MAG: hypothetical protein ACYDBB_19055 [Armatimonadota bacterium]
MAFRMKIKANTLLQNRYMFINERGVEYCESAITAGKRRFPYAAIDYVYVSPSNEISFQVGSEVFSLPYKPQDRRHVAFIETLVQQVKATTQPSPAVSTYSNSNS